MEFLVGAAERVETTNGGQLFWTDFRVFGSRGDEWVSAYVAHALAETEDPLARKPVDAAWTWLTSHAGKRGAGLGFNSGVAQDADSTVWGCRLAALTGRSASDWTANSLAFLRTCCRDNGGIATFPDEAAVQKSLGLPLRANGYTVSHACVSASAAWLPAVQGFGDIFGFLRSVQQPEGFWYGYWWSEPEYATAMAVESLVAREQGGESVDRALGWLSTVPPSASPFRLAMRLLGLTKAKRPGGSVLDSLLAEQLGDGSWTGSARMRIPPADLENPEVRWNWNERSAGFGAIVVDHARIFTTASALRALTSCLLL